MKINRSGVEGFVTASGVTLREVLVAITNNHKGSVVVVDAAGRFMGVVSDGDIRRALVKGATEFTPVEKLVNVNAQCASEGASDTELENVFAMNPGVIIVPLLGEGNVVSGIAFVEHKN